MNEPKVVEFKLPKKRPKLVQKEPAPTARRFSVLPLRAITDKRITDAMLRALAILCSYTNRAGLTWVGTERLGKDMGVTKQAISKHLVKLQKLGYIEVVRKHSWKSTTATTRVVFDESITAAEAVAITSSIEDTRPPFMTNRDEEIIRIMEDNRRPDITNEELERNRKRLEMLTKDIAKLAATMTNTPQRSYTMPKDGVTKAVKEAREEIKRRTRKPPSTTKKRTEEGGIQSTAKVDVMKPHIVNLEGVILTTPRVDTKHKNVGVEEVYRLYEKKNETPITETDARWVSLLVEAGVGQADLIEVLDAQPGASLTAVCQVLLGRLGV
jgi:hypothetical protein